MSSCLRQRIIPRMFLYYSFIFTVALTFSGLPAKVISATVSSTVAQTFLGVGGSGAWWPHDLFTFPDSVRQNLSSLLFSESGLGLSSYRYNLGSGGVDVSNPVRAPQTPYVSAGVYNFSVDPQGTYFLQQASNFGVPGITMFINSAPAPLTSNKASCAGQFVTGSGAAYATYMVDVAEHWREAGINISYISPMNEPDNSFGPIPCGQEGMLVEPSQRAEVVSSLWNELNSRGLSSAIGILADETSSTGVAPTEYSAWLPEVVDMVAHLVHHAYDFPSDTNYLGYVNAAHAASNGKTTWMSEICCSLGTPAGTGRGYSQGFDPTINNALMFAGLVFQSFVIGGEAHYDFWTLVSNEIGCEPLSSSSCATTPNSNGWTDGMIYYDPDYATNGNHELYLVKHFWTYKHFGNFVKPGTQRHPVTGSDANEYTLIVSNSTTYSVIAMNPNATASTISLTFPETVCGTTGFRTSASEDFATIAAATGSGSAWSLSLSATSLTTYIFNRKAC
ncbi:glycoside hydrolase [Lentinula aff. detonsa]|nr:glycoside hydrolase [Lentinula aff. detonsa]